MSCGASAHQSQEVDGSVRVFEPQAHHVQPPLRGRSSSTARPDRDCLVSFKPTRDVSCALSLVKRNGGSRATECLELAGCDLIANSLSSTHCSPSPRWPEVRHATLADPQSWHRQQLQLARADQHEARSIPDVCPQRITLPPRPAGFFVICRKLVRRRLTSLLAGGSSVPPTRPS